MPAPPRCFSKEPCHDLPRHSPTSPTAPKAVSSSSRRSGWFCVRRSSWTEKRLRRSRTIVASRRTPRAFRIRIACPMPSAGSPARMPSRGETYLITLAMARSSEAAARHARRRGRDRLLARHPLLGQGLRHRSGACADRSRVHQLEHQALQSSVRVTNPASRRVLEKCGFQWTGVGLCRIRALGSSVPVDRFRLERGIWTALKSWGPVKRVA